MSNSLIVFPHVTNLLNNSVNPDDPKLSVTEMVREVLMDHNVFKCRNCQWVERWGKMMLKLCENSLAYCPAPPPYEDYCNTCLSFKDFPHPDP